jgi:hypothetical protein
LAYSTDISSTFCAPPTISLARPTAAWSSVFESAGQPAPASPSGRAATFSKSSRACFRVWSMVASGVRVSPSVSPSTV